MSLATAVPKVLCKRVGLTPSPELLLRKAIRQADAGEYARQFVKSNKSDYLDAEAIAEAVQRPTIFPIKNEAQLDMQALHRVRNRWKGG